MFGTLVSTVVLFVDSPHICGPMFSILKDALERAERRDPKINTILITIISPIFLFFSGSSPCDFDESPNEPPLFFPFVFGV